MIKKRIGTDVFVWVEVYLQNAPFDFSDAEEIKVNIVNSKNSKTYLQDITRVGNKINFQINAQESSAMGGGIYNIKISYKKPSASSENSYINFILDMPNSIFLTNCSLTENGNTLGIKYYINYNNTGTDSYLQVTPELAQWVTTSVGVTYNIKSNENWGVE